MCLELVCMSCIPVLYFLMCDLLNLAFVTSTKHNLAERVCALSCCQALHLYCIDLSHPATAEADFAVQLQLQVQLTYVSG